MHPTLRTSASALVLLMGLAGCSNNSLFESKRIDYQSARTVERPLEIPPDLTGPTRDDRFAVPDVAPRGVATFSAYESDRAERPQGFRSQSEVLTEVENMRIERAGSQRWLVVRGNADELWPQVREFWMELGFVLDTDQPTIGVMETDWAEDRAKIPQDFIRRTLGRVLDGMFSTSERDKFRTRFEEGDGGMVEIYVSHRGMEEVYSSTEKDSTVWQPREADPELEAEMLRRLMVHLGAEERRAEALLASTPERDDRAALRTLSDGRAGLVLEESFDRAWRRVGLALDRIGFTVQDRDRSQGLYYVRYIDPDADVESGRSEGVLSRLAFWRSNDAPDPHGGEYRIRVGTEGRNAVVTVPDGEGGEDTSATARRILSLLQEQLR